MPAFILADRVWTLWMRDGLLRTESIGEREAEGGRGVISGGAAPIPNGRNRRRRSGPFQMWKAAGQ